MSIYSKHSSDEILRQGSLDGNRLAQYHLYQRYFERMLGICLRYCGHYSEAVEVFNAAFLKVFESLPNYQEQGSFSGWVARIVLFTAIDHARSRTKYQQHFTDREDIPEVPIMHTALDQMGAADIIAHIQCLPANERLVFSMFVIDGYSHKEIAQQLQISEGTSKWYLNQARQQLQRRLGATAELTQTY